MFDVKRLYHTWDSLECEGKTVVLRVDLDVTVEDGRPVASPRVDAARDVILALQKMRSRVVVLAHRGQPERPDPKFSLEPIARSLMHDLAQGSARFLPLKPYADIAHEVRAMAPADVLFLENVRFHKGEVMNDKALAESLAALGDVYVNDAFATCHRAHASTEGVAHIIPGGIGPSIMRELEALDPICHPTRHPYVAIVGGAKIESKLEALSSMLKTADQVFVSGAIAVTCYRAQGMEVGKSLFDEAELPLATSLLLSPALSLPEDVIVINAAHVARAALPQDIHDDETVVDIGPKTLEQMKRAIERATLLLWNGPVGIVEDPISRVGSDAVAHLVARRARGAAYGVVGGGNTLDVVYALQLQDFFDYVSSGGGAMLKYVGGASLPALDVLKRT